MSVRGRYRKDSYKGIGISVAASDADNDTKQYADYVCNGTNDDVTIELALTELVAAGGGTLNLSAGTFSLGAGEINLTELHDGIHIRGAGMGNFTSANYKGTTIKTDARGANLDIFDINAGGTLDNVSISDMTLRLNSSASAFAIRVAAAGNCRNIHLERLEIVAASNTAGGIAIASSAIDGIYITDCRIFSQYTTCYGIFVSAAASNIWIRGCYLDLSSASSYNAIAMYKDCYNYHILGNHIEHSGHSGIALSGSYNGIVSGNFVNASEHASQTEAGIEVEFKGHTTAPHSVYPSHDIVIDGNIVTAKASPGGTQHGIMVRVDETDVAAIGTALPYDITISDNRVHGVKSTGISLSNCVKINLTGNQITDCNYGVTIASTAIDVLATNNQVLGNTTEDWDDNTNNKCFVQASGNVSTIGAELVTNGDFAAWTTTDPDDWNATQPDGNEIYETDRDGTAGTGACTIHELGAGNCLIAQAVAVSDDSVYRLSVELTAVTAGGVNASWANIDIGAGVSTAVLLQQGTNVLTCIPTLALTTSNLSFSRSAGGAQCTIDNVSVRKILAETKTTTATNDETITTGSPALSVSGNSTLDSNGGAITATLGSAKNIGDEKLIVMTEASNSSTVTIALHETEADEVLTFDAVDEYALLRWTGTEWVTINMTATAV